MRAGQMIRLYKDLQLEYRLFFCAGIIITLLMISADVNYFIIYLLALFWFPICVKYFGLQAMKRLNAAAALMDKQCRVQDYLRQMLSLMERTKDRYIQLLLSINLAAAYLNLGDADKALFYLQNAAVDTKKRLPRSVSEILVVYYSNYATVYMRKGILEMADAMLDRMRNQIDSTKMNPMVRQECEKIYERKRMRMQMLRGNYEGVEEYCQRELKTEQVMIRKIFLYDFLREAYLHEGKEQEARECCDFIMENGGDTYYAARIRDGSIS